MIYELIELLSLLDGIIPLDLYNKAREKSISQLAALGCCDLCQ